MFLLLYKINCNISELHYSLQKEPKLQKEQTNAVKRYASIAEGGVANSKRQTKKIEIS